MPARPLSCYFWRGGAQRDVTSGPTLEEAEKGRGGGVQKGQGKKKCPSSLEEFQTFTYSCTPVYLIVPVHAQTVRTLQ